ncbi:MAG: hypothetical protein H6526_08850 [Actinobacteria bacterium]|nr:hypothetical protein [Actinomycetota bacterium]
MARDIRQAPSDLALLANLLKRAGRGDLRRQLLAAIRKEGGPSVKAAQEAAQEALPQRGGFADLVAKNISVRSSLSGSSASVRIRRKGKIPTDRTMTGIDESGTWRHPVFTRAVWVEQSAPGAVGWFTKSIDATAPAYRSAILQAMEDVAAKLRRV